MWPQFFFHVGVLAMIHHRQSCCLYLFKSWRDDIVIDIVIVIILCCSPWSLSVLVLCTIAVIKGRVFHLNKRREKKHRIETSCTFSSRTSSPLTWRPWLTSSSTYNTEEERTELGNRTNIIDGSTTNNKTKRNELNRQIIVPSEPLTVTRITSKITDKLSFHRSHEPWLIRFMDLSTYR